MLHRSGIAPVLARKHYKPILLLTLDLAANDFLELDHFQLQILLRPVVVITFVNQIRIKPDVY